MIVMAVIGSVIVVGLAWAGWHDYRNRRRERGASPSIEENLRRRQALDGRRLGDAGPRDPGGGSAW
jgi:hypothetical protein